MTKLDEEVMINGEFSLDGLMRQCVHYYEKPILIQLHN